MGRWHENIIPNTSLVHPSFMCVGQMWFLCPLVSHSQTVSQAVTDLNFVFQVVDAIVHQTRESTFPFASWKHRKELSEYSGPYRTQIMAVIGAIFLESGRASRNVQQQVCVGTFQQLWRATPTENPGPVRNRRG